MWYVGSTGCEGFRQQMAELLSTARNCIAELRCSVNNYIILIIYIVLLSFDILYCNVVICEKCPMEMAFPESPA